MSEDAYRYGCIFLLAAITYSLRLGGLLIGSRLPSSGRAAELLERLPALVLVSLVAPAIFELGWLGLAAALAAAAAWRVAGGSLLAAILAGAGIVAIGRQL